MKCTWKQINDGKIDYEALYKYGKNQEWLVGMIEGNRIDDIFIALLKKDGMYIVKRKLS